MKKIAIVFLAILLGVSSVFATESRVRGMGGVGMYIHDDTNIYMFPGLISRYHNQVVGELGVDDSSNDSRYGMINYYFEDAGIDIGYHFNLPVYDFPGNDPLDHVSLKTKGMLTVGYGNLGAGIAMGGESWEDPAVTDGLKSETTGLIELIGGYSITDGNMPMDLGGSIAFTSGEAVFNGVGQPGDGTGSGFELNLHGRLWMEMKDISIIPAFSFGLGAVTMSQDDANGDALLDSVIGSTNFGLGLGISHQVSEQNLIVFAFEPLRMNHRTYETKITGIEETKDSTQIILPAIYAAIETKPTSWMTIRVGAAQMHTYSSGSTGAGGVTTDSPKSKKSTFGYTFGLGFQFNHFEIDGVFNEQFMYDGPHFVSGMPNALFNRISIKYTW
ncbi:hypothetical protein K8I28_17680 [bacterium]|nr:hypothetical protein [bacterium]